MWFTPDSTASRRTATASSVSRGGPKTCGPASCMGAVTHPLDGQRSARQRKASGKASLFNHFFSPVVAHHFYRESQNVSPTISSLFFQSASAFFGSSAYPRTPSLTAVIGASSGTMWPTWQFSQYCPPISVAGATTAAHTEVAAPWGTDFH